MSLVSSRNTLFLKQDKQMEDKQIIGAGGMVVGFWGFLPYIEDTIEKITSEKLTTQKSGSHRWKNSLNFVLGGKMEKMP